MANRFDEIYARNEWVYGSGEGSLARYNKRYVSFLQRFIADQKIKSVVDMGCGDWQFSRYINWGAATYRGFDVASAVIARNQAEFTAKNVSFHLYSGNPAELPEADLLIAKDVLQHLPNAVVFDFLAALPKYRHALITNCGNPRADTVNCDIEAGAYRHLDLRKPPFNLQAAEVLVYSKPMHPVKHLLRKRPEWTKRVLLVSRD